METLKYLLFCLILSLFASCAHYYHVTCKANGEIYYNNKIEEHQLVLPDRQTFVIINDDGSERLFKSNECLIMRDDLESLL